MPSVYILNNLESRQVTPEGFDTKHAAKVLRNKLRQEGKTCVVSRGPDHPLGPSRVDARCLNTEKTAKFKLRKLKNE